MSFLSGDISKIKEVAAKKATDLGISKEDFDSKIQAIQAQLEEAGIPAEDIEEKSYSRFLGSLRKRSSQNVKALNGIVFARTQLKDFDNQSREKALEYAKEHGEEKAIEENRINKKGQALYPAGDRFNREGKVIPDDTRKSSLIGFFEVDGKGDFYEISLNGKVNDIEIPQFKKVTLLVRFGTRKTDFGTPMSWLNGYDGLMGEPLKTKEFAKFLIDSFEDKVIGSWETLQKRGDEGKRDDWYITEGQVVRSGDITMDNDSVPHDIISTDPTEEDISTFWVRKSVLTGLHDIDDQNVLMVIRPYTRRDGTLSGDVYGILPEYMPKEKPKADF